MADLLATISSNYVAMGSLYATAGKKYENVDPALFEGTWRGKYADGKSFAVGVSNVNGFRATARYESGGTVKYQNVLIANDGTFRVGDTKFRLTKPGTAEIKTVMMKDGQPSTIETAYAKQNG
jgi:archaellum component FlaF (FlaF/FlaG flagellin family)